MKRLIGAVLVLGLFFSCGATQRRATKQNAPQPQTTITSEMMQAYTQLAQLNYELWSEYVLPKVAKQDDKKLGQDYNCVVVVLASKPDESMQIRFPRVILLGLWVTPEGEQISIIRVSETVAWAIKRKVGQSLSYVNKATMGRSITISPVPASVEDLKPVLALIDIDDDKTMVMPGPRYLYQ